MGPRREGHLATDHARDSRRDERLRVAHFGWTGRGSAVGRAGRRGSGARHARTARGWTFNGGSLNFSPDGTKLFVNTAPKREPIGERPPGPPRADDFQLDLWHWKDERLQPTQKLQAAADQSKTFSAVVLLDSKQFRQLSDDTITVSQPPSASDWALGSDNRKYRHATGYGLPLSDYTAVNVRTGEKKSLLNGFGGYSTPTPLLSPTGKYLLSFDGKNWSTLSIADGQKTNLTGKLKEKFFDEEDDHPGSPRAIGQPQWTTDGQFIVVNDRYDIWKFAADGSTAENLTKIGRTQQIRFTILRVQSGDELEPVRGVDLSKPQLLGAENLHTRDTGFYRLEPGARSRSCSSWVRAATANRRRRRTPTCTCSPCRPSTTNPTTSRPARTSTN